MPSKPAWPAPMQTALSRFSELLLTIYRQAQALPISQFQDRVLETIQCHLQFDSAMWGTATMTDGGIDIHSIHLHRSSQAMLDAYAQVKHLDTVAIRVTQQQTATIGFNARVDFADCQAFLDFLTKFGHEHGLVTSDINPVSKFVHWVSLFRASPDHVCTDDDLQILRHLAPHLMQALAINRMIHLEKLASDVVREVWAMAIVDARGVIYHADARFLELVQMEWSEVDTQRLPAASMQQLLTGDQRFVGQRVAIQRNLEHGLVFLKARNRCPADSLSPREVMVARLLASGLSQKEVALKLNRSKHTVSSHARAVFDKLKISNVSMLTDHLALRD